MKKIKVLLLILFTILCINSLNVVKAAEELPDNGAHISSAVIIQTKTGTAPFDADDTAGNDSSDENNIVRSFDQVTWTIENTMMLNSSEATGYCGGKLYFEAVLPDSVDPAVIEWDTEAMSWADDLVVSSDKRTITGYYQLGTDNITIPGKQTLVFYVDVHGASNGTQFQPTINLWLNGNSETDKKIIIPEKITVSAKPRYNLKLLKTDINAIAYLDVDGTETEGKVNGYNVIAQLYGESAAKGMKGMEYPKGNITFDVELRLDRYDLNGGNAENITDLVNIILYNYSLNGNNGSHALTRSRNWNYYSGTSTPNGNRYTTLNPSQNVKDRYIYDSGNISIKKEGNILHVTIKDYSFDGTFPKKSYDGANNTIYYADNVGCFSLCNFQTFIPSNNETTKANSNFYFDVKVTNMNINSISDILVTDQAVTTDDESRTQYVAYSPGSYWMDYYFLNYSTGAQLHTMWNRGDGVIYKGSKVLGTMSLYQSSNNTSIRHTVKSINALYKFDTDGFEITTYDNGDKFRSTSSKAKFNMYYAAKKDGTGWASITELNSAGYSDLKYYNTLEELYADGNQVCVAALFETYECDWYVPAIGTNIQIRVPLIVKETANYGQTYQECGITQFYTTELDRSVESLMVNGGSYTSSTVFNRFGTTYKKTEYDENGVQIPGTHSSVAYGNSLLVVGAESLIKNEIISTTTDGTIKTNFDMGRSEYTVKYKLTPSITAKSNNLDTTTATLKVTDILPQGLTYIPNSCEYGEPEITINDDGTTTLIWYIYDCVIGEAVEPIIFEAHIDEESENGVQYTTIATVYAGDMDRRKEELRQSSNTISIVNLASHRLYKTVTTPVIEKNGEIHYSLSYKNNTDSTIPNFQLLDILPYNGDGRGTNYTGTYKLDRLVVTQEDENGNVLSNDNLTIVYTKDTGVRKGVTSKDTNLGNGWTSLTASDLNQIVTAFVVKGEIPGQGKVTIDIYLKTENNKGLDKYVNNATAQVYLETEEILTSTVISQVVERKIEGIAWEDTNGNGIKDNNESIFKNVEITLTDDQGRQVTDVNGNIVSGVRTDENGAYVFENLPKGNYYVKVSMPSSKYQLTEKEVGANTEINSKFGIENKETDKITKLNSTDLPEITVSYVNAGLVKKLTKVIVNYKEEGTNTVLHDEVTIDGRIDDSYTTVDKIDTINANHGNKYEYVRVEGNTTGTMTEDTIYVTYYYQKKETNVKVLHVVEGTDVTNPESVTNTLYQTEEIIGRVDDPYTTQNRLTEINQNHKEQYDFVKVTNNATGNMAVDTIYVIYEYKTIPAVVKVRHLEKDTDTVLSEQETLNGLVGNDYTTVDRLTEINNKFGNKYELVANPDNKNGTYTRDEQVVTYYYQKKLSSIEVNYLEVGTNAVLSEQIKSEGRIDDAYTTENKLDAINQNNANKYEFVKVDGNANGNYTLDKQVITYWYQKKMSSIEVNYVELNTNVVLEAQITKTGRIDDEYTTENKLDIINENFSNKYEFVKVDGSAAGKYTLDKQVITYYYQKKLSSIEVNYLEVGTETVLETKVTKEGRIDDAYTTENKLDVINENHANKYEFVKVDGNANGNYTLDKQVITYWYQKKMSSIEVNYVELDTNVVLSEMVTKEGRIDEDYTTENKLDSINQNYENKYEFVKVEGNAEGQYALDKQIITYYYQKKLSSIEVNYLEIGTEIVLSEQITAQDRIDAEYITEDKIDSINENHGNKYEFVRVDGNPVGNYTLDKQVITYWYQKKESSIEVNYLEVGTNAILETRITSTGRVDDPYTTVDKLDVINGKFADKYEFVKVDGNKEGNYTVDKQIITYWYQKKMSSIEVNYLEVGTNAVLSEMITKEGRIDDAYTTENKLDSINEKNANKYEFVKVDGNTEGQYTLDKQVITYWYQKKETDVVVKYVDINTNEELYNQATIEGRVDDEYTTIDELENINKEYENKYEFVKDTGNTNGNMTLDRIEVVYYYQKKMSSIEVNYLEVGTETVLEEQVTSEGRIDDNYTTENKLDKINETYANKYEFVKVDGNVEGKYTLDKQVITYWYQKKMSSVEVNYVEIGTNEVLSEMVTKEGRIDDNYTTENKLDSINENLGNKYEFVKVEGNTEGKFVLDKQVVTYYYQKKPTSVITKYVDINTNEEIYDQAKIDGRVDDEYTTVNELDNINVKYENIYEFVKDTENTSGNMTVEQIEVVYYYQKKEAKVIVLHVEEGTDVSNPENVTNTLHPNEEIGGRVDDEYTTQNRVAEINETHTEQYDFVRVTDNATGKFILDVQYVIYEYKKAPAKIHIKHVDLETGKELVEEETREDYVGISYTTSDRLEEINEAHDGKYEVYSKPANKDGVYAREEQTIVYYYQKKETNVIVKYLDIDSEEELATSEEIIGRVDEKYTTKDKVEEINETYAPYKYVLVKTTENTEGNMAAETIEVVYYYQKVEAQVIVKHLDEKTGEEIADKDFLGGYVGEEYETSSKEIEGYELVEKKIPANKEGQFAEETIEVIYYYSKIPEPIIELPELPVTGDINLMLMFGVMLASIYGITRVRKLLK